MDEDLKYALDHSLDMGPFPDVFPEDYGMDFHLDEHPDWFPKKRIRSDKKERSCTISITSYSGYCAGAIHYYATIKADGISICSISKDENGKEHTTSHGGYLGKEFEQLPREKKAEYNGVYEIDVNRFVTKKEIEEDPKRWEHYEEGDKTNAFSTKKEAKDTALKVAKARFPKGWKIEVVDEC